MTAVERLVVRLMADATDYNRVFNTAETRMLTFATMAGVASTLVGKEVLKMAADYEQAAIAFEVMTGSAQKGKNLLDEITKLAIETPFQSPELVAAAKQLKAFGVETDQIIPTLRALGDVSSGTGTELSRIVLAFGQVRVSGRLMGPELRQFTDAGIPVIENLAAVMGKPVSMIKKMVQEGEVGFPLVVRAFNRMTQSGGLFANMMQRQSETVAGRWSALTENLSVAGRNIGLSFFKGFGLADLLKEFGDITTGLQSHTGRLEGFFGRLREVFDVVRTAVEALLQVMGERLTAAFKNLTGTSFEWNDFKGMVVGTIEAIIIAFGHLLEMLANITRKIATAVIQPTGEALTALGKTEERTWHDNANTAIRTAFAPFYLLVDPKGFGKSIGKDVGDLYTALMEPDSVKKFKEAAAKSGPAVELLGRELEKLAPQSDLAKDALARFKQAMTVHGDPNNYWNTPDGFERYQKALAAQEIRDNQGFFEKIQEAMKVPFSISAKAVKLAEGIQESQLRGIDPYEQFKKTSRLLDEAFWGKNFEQAMKQPDAFMGKQNPGGVLTKEERAFGLYQAFKELRKDLGSAIEVKLPPAALYGSVEAQNTINRTMAEQKDISADILHVLETARIIHEKQLKAEEDTVRILDDLRKSGVIKVKGFGG